MDFDELMKTVGAKMNEVRDVVMDFTDKAGKKAGEIYGDTKVKLKIADIQRDINHLYREVGKAAYTANQAGEDIAAVIGDKCSEIQRLYAEMEELNKSLSKDKEETAPEAGDDVIEVEAQESPAPEEDAPAAEAPEDAAAE